MPPKASRETGSGDHHKAVAMIFSVLRPLIGRLVSAVFSSAARGEEPSDELVFLQERSRLEGREKPSRNRIRIRVLGIFYMEVEGNEKNLSLIYRIATTLLAMILIAALVAGGVYLFVGQKQRTSDIERTNPSLIQIDSKPLTYRPAPIGAFSSFPTCTISTSSEILS